MNLDRDGRLEAARLSAAAVVGRQAVSPLLVWDELSEQRTRLDRFSAEEQGRQQRANTAYLRGGARTARGAVRRRQQDRKGSP